MRLTKSLVVLGLVVALGACGAPRRTRTTRPLYVPTGLVGQPWRLVSIRWPDGRVTQATNPARYFIEFQTDGRAAGLAGCNRISGRYVGDTRKLALGPFTSTRMACRDPSLADEWVQALEQTQAWRLTNGRLQLQLAGAGVIDLEPAPKTATTQAGTRSG